MVDPGAAPTWLRLVAALILAVAEVVSLSCGSR
jgi:hypothetical protein